MNLFTKIKNYLTKSSNKADNKNQLEYSYISFLFDENGEPHIRISIADTSQHAAKQLAFVLNGINTGMYADDMLKILVDIGNQDSSINRFMKTVFVEWGALHGIYSKDNINLEPEIKPTEFLKGFKNGT